MRTVIQRVTHASCTVDGVVTGAIERGFLVLVGFTAGDDLTTVRHMAHKIASLRVFEDAEEKMNLSLSAVGGKVLSISQFTLYGDATKGARPSFVNALAGHEALPLYEAFNDSLAREGLDVATGIFGAHMEISLLNDGPCTILLDSKGDAA